MQVRIKKLLSTASRKGIMERSAAATMLATEKAAAATGTQDVIDDFDTDMLLWLEAFRPVTGDSPGHASFFC